MGAIIARLFHTRSHLPYIQTNPANGQYILQSATTKKETSVSGSSMVEQDSKHSIYLPLKKLLSKDTAALGG